MANASVKSISNASAAPTTHETAIPSFLRLPRQIRSKIYARCGLLCKHISGLDLDGFSSGLTSTAAYHRRMTISLFLTCKMIYKEVSSLVFANNDIHVSYHTTRSLSGLRRLNPACISALRTLIIHLNVTSCGQGFYDASCNPPTPPDMSANRALSSQDPTDRSRIDDWTEVWTKHLQPHIRPGRLHFSFICDVEDLETASLVVQPLLEGGPPAEPLLADLTIRLGRHPRDDLSKLTGEVIETLTASSVGSDDDQTPFRFMDLPVELRLQILAYTELVAPQREVEWNSEARMFFVRHLSAPYHPGYDTTRWRELQWPEPCWDKTYKHGCFCRAQHAAFSSEHACDCWRRPTSLFLVSHGFRADARQVFFRENRFVVCPNIKPWEDADTPARIPPAIFLSEVVPEDCLRHIRGLDLVFPSLGKINVYCSPQSIAGADWVQTLERAKAHLNLPNLTLRVTFAKWHPGSWAGHGTFETEVPDYRQSRSEPEFQLVRQSFRDTIAPLKRLAPVKALFVHLPDPWEFSRSYYAISGSEAGYTDWKRRQEEIRVVEARTEKFVMGEDYDASVTGKAEMPRALWSWDFERYWCDL